MASNLTIEIGPISSTVSLGALSDATMGARIKAWAVGSGVASATDTNQQVADKVTAWLAARFREHVKQWHISAARTTFEQDSAAAGSAYLDVE